MVGCARLSPEQFRQRLAEYKRFLETQKKDFLGNFKLRLVYRLNWPRSWQGDWQITDSKPGSECWKECENFYLYSLMQPSIEGFYFILRFAVVGSPLAF